MSFNENTQVSGIIAIKNIRTSAYSYMETAMAVAVRLQA